MRYLDVCSGISAPTQAWKPLGWEPACFAEIEPAPRAVLAHHYPDTPLRGDFTEIDGTEYGAIDLLVGGTPCQSFSVAGLRGGLADDRGNLALEYLRLADRARPRWLVWENVPGVLSSNGGRDFGAILGGMGELGYGFAYRVLDAQHFGVPQRRRRVFVVGYLGDWRRAAAVLFERHSLQGHPAPRREAGPSVAALTANGVGTCGADDNQGQAGHLLHCERISRSLTACNTATGRLDPNEMEFVAFNVTPSNSNKGFDASEDGTGRGTPLVPVQAFYSTESRAGFRTDGNAYTLEARTVPQAVAYQTSGNAGAWETGQITGALDTMTDPNSHVVAFAQNQLGEIRSGDVFNTLNTNSNASGRNTPMVASSSVRRLTPRECERLQGFPDNFTFVPYRGRMMADGPRYKMLGNSMAVPVVRWIGERIALVEALSSLRAAA